MSDRKPVIISEEQLEEQRQYIQQIRLMPDAPKSYHVVTYGCQMNAHDSEILAGMLRDMGMEEAADRESADFVLFNTCCVRDNAERRALGNVTWLKEVRKKNPRLMIGVCGCMIQQPGMAEKILKQYRFVDLAFGTANLYRLPELMLKALESDHAVVEVEEQNTIAEGLPVQRLRHDAAYITIMYGCDNYCTYCIVPYVRGRERSREMSAIVAEAEALRVGGVKEIMLLGQNVNSYGKGLQTPVTFAQLLKALDDVGIPRIRFMTSHPKDLSDELIDVMAHSKHILPQFHLPVQHGNDEILRRMNRHYNRAQYLDRVRKLREAIPAIGLTTDIIVGFPEMIKELPKEIICLNWGYMWNQREEETKWMYEAGAVQYCCPGCCGWNEFSALNWYAYNNIMRMCTYANKYGAIGLLNTDWGDYLHVNHPDFTRVGMIYGAAFSWNSNILSYEDINRQISRIEYRDSSENYLAVVAKIQENSGYDWNVAVRYWEMKRGLHEQDEVSVGLMKERIGQMDNIDQKDANLKEIARELYAQIEQMDSSKRALVMPQIVAVDAIRIFNQIGKFATADVLGCTYENMPDSWALAKELETWFYFYKRVYRSISEESELRYIQELVCWYGDYLRQIK